MGKNAIFGIILIIISIVIILYVNAGITKFEHQTIKGPAGAYLDSRKGPSTDDFEKVPVLKTVRFVGYVIGITGFFLLLAGLFGQPRKIRRKGAIYIE
jgi:quinol-cytochrome oxidoreductase complex cytochrome b subunit